MQITNGAKRERMTISETIYIEFDPEDTWFYIVDSDDLSYDGTGAVVLGVEDIDSLIEKLTQLKGRLKQTIGYTPEDQKEIAKINDFLARWPNAEWGPAHIVLSDYNTDKDFITYCLGEIKEYDGSNYSFPHSLEELEATREFLEGLLNAANPIS